ncbi:LamG-like jellyroll fold domain-containing protein [Snuella lapsa]|uniref:PKD domain-containing protein n=1 Tax=Snuella lapsa TaxID=870481 RepID=A0ABP6XKR7_9FLAO
MRSEKTYKNNFLKSATLCIVAFFIACSPNENGYRDKNKAVDPSLLSTVDISASATEIFAEESVTFTDNSSNGPVLYSWTFEGGTPTTSSEKNPVVTYPAAGVFSVSLKVRNAYGISEEVTFEDYITVEGAPIPYLSNYAFNGNLVDKGLNKFDALSNYGDPTYAEDRKGNANSSWQAPDVADQYLTIPGFKGIGGDNPRTVMAWFKLPPEVTNRSTIVSWGTNSITKMFNIMVHGSRIRIEAGSSNVRTDEAFIFNDNVWHHLAVSYDPTDGPYLKDVKIYVDGVLIPNATDATGSFNSETRLIDTDLAGDVMIGQAIYNANHRFKGEIDDLRIIDTALLPAEISAVAAE